LSWRDVDLEKNFIVNAYKNLIGRAIIGREFVKVKKDLVSFIVLLPKERLGNTTGHRQNCLAVYDDAGAVFKKF
jgi:hypothetical protein